MADRAALFGALRATGWAQCSLVDQGGWTRGPACGAARLAALIEEREQRSDERALVLDVVSEVRSPDGPTLRRLFGDDARGLSGVRIDLRGDVVDVHASELLAKTISVRTAIRDVATRRGLTLREALPDLEIRELVSMMFLHQGRSRSLTRLERGALPIRCGPMTTKDVAEMAEGCVAYLAANMGEDGALPYTLPLRDDGRDNAIRQLMTTWTLVRYAALTGRGDVKQLARRNLAWNLGRMLIIEDGVGILMLQGSAKLGASAFAALAILALEGPSGPQSDALAAILAGIDRLWLPDGSFRTFHHPSERNDNQNFYPGETLLLWATLLALEPEEQRWTRFRQSFLFYRGFFRSAPNPAFVPWHIMAYARMLGMRSDDEMRAFVFEMADWLLGFQRGDETCPDLVGRFYDPDRRHYGPPHASSTAVYVEGLIAAEGVASRAGEETRAEAYGSAIGAGLVNLMNLQIKPPEALLHAAPLAAGGIKTNPFDWTIRIDNVQHTLAAACAWMEQNSRAITVADDAGLRAPDSLGV